MVNTLLDLFLKSSGVSTDTRRLKAGNIFFALTGPNFDGNAYAAGALQAGAAYAVVDDTALAETDERYILVDDSLIALQELATAYRRTWTCPVVALTGSNGKTTTKELLAAALAKNYTVCATVGNLNNHIGVPLTLLSVPTEVDIVVVEMGANHQGEIAELCTIAEPTHGFITNIGRAHLEGFGGPEGIRKGKGELYDYLAKSGGHVFVAADNSMLEDMSTRVGKRLKYSCTPTADGLPGSYLLTAQLLTEWPTITAEFVDKKGREQIISRLPGRHNYENLCQAAAVAHYFKVPLAQIAAAFSEYEPTNQRSETKKIGNAVVLLDAYNANPDSMNAGLNWLGSREEANKVAILGEMMELGAFAKTAHQAIIDRALEAGSIQYYLYGSNFGNSKNPPANVVFALSTDELVESLSHHLNDPKAVILLKGSRSSKLEQVLAKAEALYTKRL